MSTHLNKRWTKNLTEALEEPEVRISEVALGWWAVQGLNL
jgi:hypothetical protein